MFWDATAGQPSSILSKADHLYRNCEQFYFVILAYAGIAFPSGKVGWGPTSVVWITGAHRHDRLNQSFHNSQ